MPFPKQLPAPVSHLKARLRAIQRPMVWGSGTILLMIVFFTVGYWLHPEWFDNTRNASNVEGGFNPSVSPEDGAIGADIDSLPLLINQLNGIPVEEASQQKEKSTKQPSLFRELLDPKSQTGNGVPNNNSSAALQASASSSLLSAPSSASSSLPSQPLVGATPRLTGIGSSVPSTVPGSLLSPTGMPNSTSSLTPPNVSSTASPVPVSALQKALEQYPVQTNTATSSPSGSPTVTGSGNAGLGNNVTAPTSTTQTLAQPNAIAPIGNSGINYSGTPGISSEPPGNSFNYLSQPPTDSLPTNSSVPAGIPPVVPTTPFIAPVAPSSNLGPNFGQPSFQGSQNNTGFNNPSFSGNAGLQPSQLNQQPFSVPRRVPGRNIGGGQINTFSNP